MRLAGCGGKSMRLAGLGGKSVRLAGCRGKSLRLAEYRRSFEILAFMNFIRSVRPVRRFRR